MDERMHGSAEDDAAVLVGAYVRIEPGATAAARAALAALPRTEVFDIDGVDAEADGVLGVLVAADDLDRAHERVQRDVRTCTGVLGVWPICVDLEGAAVAAADSPPAGSDRREGDDR